MFLAEEPKLFVVVPDEACLLPIWPDAEELRMS